MFSQFDNEEVETYFNRLNAPLKKMLPEDRAEMHQEVRQHLDALAAAHEELGATPRLPIIILPTIAALRRHVLKDEAQQSFGQTSCGRPATLALLLLRPRDARRGAPSETRRSRRGRGAPHNFTIR